MLCLPAGKLASLNVFRVLKTKWERVYWLVDISLSCPFITCFGMLTWVHCLACRVRECTNTPRSTVLTSMATGTSPPGYRVVRNWASFIVPFSWSFVARISKIGPWNITFWHLVPLLSIFLQPYLRQGWVVQIRRRVRRRWVTLFFTSSLVHIQAQSDTKLELNL